MKTNEELKDQVIANLSVENVTLRNELEELKKAKSRVWGWYNEEKTKAEEFEAKLNALNGTEVVEEVIETETK